jgi:hypothetical protein
MVWRGRRLPRPFAEENFYEPRRLDWSGAGEKWKQSATQEGLKKSLQVPPVYQSATSA